MAGIGFGLSPLISRQGWWEDNWPGASMAIDFTQDKAMVLGREKVISDVLSITRASTKWIADSTGLIKPYSANTLAYNDLGLDVEESRTNLLTYSDEFDNVTSWYNSHINVSGNKLIPNTDYSRHYCIQQTSSTADNIDVTLSAYAKKGEYNYLCMQIRDKTGAYSIASFSLVDGSYTINSGSPSVAVAQYGEYFLVSITANTNAGATTPAAIVMPSNNNSNSAFAGDGTSGVYVEYAQLEEGSFHTSPIKTSGSAVTRAADKVQFSDLTWAADEGTWLIATDSGNAGEYRVLLYSTAVYYAYITQADHVKSYKNPKSHDFGLQTYSDNILAFTQSLSGEHSSLNGASVIVSDLILTRPQTALYVGWAGTAYLNGKIKKLVFFPSIKPDSELQALTS